MFASLLFVLTAIFLSLACADDDKPKAACDYSYEEFRGYFGGPGPAELDFDGDGIIRADDYNAWIAECGE